MAAADRGATDKAIVAVLFQGGLRRSEAAALRWGDVQDAADGRGIVVYVRRSKNDQDGTAADVRYLKNGCASALRQLRDRLTVQRSGLRPDGTAQVLGGINGQSIARRLTAAAHLSRRRPKRAGGSRHGWLPTTRRPVAAEQGASRSAGITDPIQDATAPHPGQVGDPTGSLRLDWHRSGPRGDRSRALPAMDGRFRAPLTTEQGERLQHFFRKLQ